MSDQDAPIPPQPEHPARAPYGAENTPPWLVPAKPAPAQGDSE